MEFDLEQENKLLAALGKKKEDYHQPLYEDKQLYLDVLNSFDDIDPDLITYLCDMTEHSFYRDDELGLAIVRLFARDNMCRSDGTFCFDIPTFFFKDKKNVNEVISIFEEEGCFGCCDFDVFEYIPINVCQADKDIMMTLISDDLYCFDYCDPTIKSDPYILNIYLDNIDDEMYDILPYNLDDYFQNMVLYKLDGSNKDIIKEVIFRYYGGYPEEICDWINEGLWSNKESVIWLLEKMRNVGCIDKDIVFNHISDKLKNDKEIIKIISEETEVDS